MAQLSLYLDEPTLSVLKTNASREKLSLSKMAQKSIRSYAPHQWPAGFWDLYGAVDDEMFCEPEELSWGLDAPRAQL
ncbi:MULTISPECIES: antitoxin [unclassified Adlercreutzia]|uniref:antitoxin n=1 Tax=unclassified Adlercreutzia TaxID=2636013 RepID=UPI0013EAAFFD|nr:MULTISPECIES: antitoxin [unclassified Adlercreutzia]